MEKPCSTNPPETASCSAHVFKSQTKTSESRISGSWHGPPKLTTVNQNTTSCDITAKVKGLTHMSFLDIGKFKEQILKTIFQNKCIWWFINQSKLFVYLKIKNNPSWKVGLFPAVKSDLYVQEKSAASTVGESERNIKLLVKFRLFFKRWKF